MSVEKKDIQYIHKAGGLCVFFLFQTRQHFHLSLLSNLLFYFVILFPVFCRWILLSVFSRSFWCLSSLFHLCLDTHFI